MGIAANGLKLSGTGKMVLEKAATTRLATVEPTPDSSPATINGQNGKGVYPSFEVIHISIKYFLELPRGLGTASGKCTDSNIKKAA
jgi:hypothetical protein